LLTSAFLTPDAYVHICPTGPLGVGTALSRSERGAVVEIDKMLSAMARRKLAIDEIFVNERELKKIKALLGADEIVRYPSLSEGNGPMLTIYPRLPQGTIIGWSDKTTIVGKKTEDTIIKHSAEVLFSANDYHAIYWPPVTRQQQVGVYVEERLDIREPAAMAIITNIGAGESNIKDRRTET